MWPFSLFKKSKPVVRVSSAKVTPTSPPPARPAAKAKPTQKALSKRELDKSRFGSYRGSGAHEEVFDNSLGIWYALSDIVLYTDPTPSYSAPVAETISPSYHGTSYTDSYSGGGSSYDSGSSDSGGGSDGGGGGCD